MKLRPLICMLLAGLCNVAAGEIKVVDFQGRSVTLSAPAQRIVALAPHSVENIFSAGAGSKVVGVVSYSNYPEAAKSIERIGSYKSWSAESIVALEPDLIIMWASGNGMNTLSALRKLGVPIFISDPHSPEDVSYTIRAIGKLAGTEHISEVEARRIEQDFAALELKYSTRSPVSTLYQVWNEPLQTLNGEHTISRVLEMCGGRNAFADAVSLAPKISIESVLHRDPDAIVASGMGAARPEWLDQWKQYPSMTAVKNNALFFVHPDHIQRPTARLLLGAKSLCEHIDTVRKNSTE